MDPRYDWQLQPEPDQQQVQKLAAALQVTPLVAKLAAERGITSAADWAHFTQPHLEDLHDPFALHDMDKAVQRIMTAVEEGQHITIYGDYDVDGLTSTTIMKEALESIGAEPDVYIPNRFTDGYGPNRDVYERLQQGGTELLITVDNGVSGHDEIAWAMANGMDVVVTDHHELPEQLPDAVAVVHPRYPGSNYPFGDLSGAGVALKVASALLDEVPVESIDLAALGAIADVVSLTDENRIFVQIGLQMLRESPRTGIAALLAAAHVDPKTVDEQTVGFVIAPRLNAIGRMGDATPGVTLLSTFDQEEATKLAGQIDQTNRTRQETVAAIADTALAEAQSPANQKLSALVIAHAGWHQGVLGIVASKVVEATGKPTLILTIDPQTGVAKGSGRSVPAFHLFHGLQKAADLMTHFGGHAAAAGMSLPAENIDQLRSILSAAAAPALKENPRMPLTVSGRIESGAITKASYHELRQLAPFGEGNPQPVFTMVPSVIDNVKSIGKDGKHLRFRVDGQLGSIAFNMGQLAGPIGTAEKVKLAFTIGENTFNGNTSLQLEIKDLQIQANDVIDLREPTLNRAKLAAAATYVFFDAHTSRRLTNSYQFGGPTILASKLAAGTKNVVLVDVPHTAAELASVMQKVELPVSIMFFATPADLIAVPTRQEFGQVLVYLRAHPQFDKHKLGLLARAVHMNVNQVILAVQVFFQLKFVTIDGALISVVNNPEKHALEDAPAYQERNNAIVLAKHLQTAGRAALQTELLRYRD
ncbi:single-stranded-DNA-specific exonuclease RecJ [Lacticaseibacillus sharpeae]|uniref:Single-stranded-DNA-specific exonuclease RecJ n=2 Tax=Lacticaseibacillus sharpeae TaxID=1626 RepID=A0A0R1ZL61_9LACO|nr:single-stranded-DNA-specific exonuclease RecJ [Lacticaseibacillus sharpeae]KRM55729.1 single-stranded DNA-specific exonuclease [Lacticaseibacillus sharpeae JCM 1186 = DSM 20505]